MRNCQRDLHFKMLRGETGWCSDREYPRDKYMPWLMIILGIAWVAFLIILAIA